MIKFDFSTYMKNYVEIALDKNLQNTLFKKLENDNMTGWYQRKTSKEVIEKIEETSSKITSSSDVLLVIAIGGSFMGSYALKEMFIPSFIKQKTEVIYIGNNLSSKYLQDVLDYIKDKDISVNVISKSGTTLEINLTYKIIKDFLENKYSQEELQKRIIITTDKENGLLREEANKNNYTSFEIDKNIGGRYSMITPAHLLPLSVLGLDINELISGYMNGFNYKDEAYIYANIRNELFEQNKLVENFSVYEPSMYYFTEWLKQLFGESEGKSNKGIFPVSSVNTRDLHSLGQFLQEGKNIVFETVIKVENTNDIVLNNYTLNDINQKVLTSVATAHYQENTPSNIITIEKLSLYNIGELISFFMMSSALSAYLFNVNPFDQPGVEKYKKEIKNNINITNL